MCGITFEDGLPGTPGTPWLFVPWIRGHAQGPQRAIGTDAFTHFAFTVFATIKAFGTDGFKPDYLP
jgi:hypothetical protein